MIKKARRLPIGEFYKKRSTTRNLKFFTVKIAQNKINHGRFGVIASSKAFPRAVDRHTVRRKLFSLLQFFPNTNHDMLFILKSEIKNLTHQELKAEVQSLEKELAKG